VRKSEKSVSPIVIGQEDLGESESDVSTALDVPAFFHVILFAYQKTLRRVLGSGEAIFVHPVLEIMSKIDKEKGLGAIRGETLDEVFSNFAKDLLASHVVTKAWFEKTGSESYTFHVEGCRFAPHTHGLLKPKDVVCPLALVAMSMYNSESGKKVQLAETEFSCDGAKTLITAKQ
jgi:hypothetical protein